MFVVRIRGINDIAPKVRNPDYQASRGWADGRSRGAAWALRENVADYTAVGGMAAPGALWTVCCSVPRDAFWGPSSQGLTVLVDT